MNLFFSRLLRIASAVGIGVLALSCCSRSKSEKLPVYLDDTKPVDERVSDALSRMTVQEKVKIIHAQSKFSSAGVPRLGIPELWTDDGPHGVRPEVFWDKWSQAGWTNDSCTAFPALTALAATWDTEVSYLYGKSLGEEARYRKKDVILGPGVNIYRTPLGGRNFEYLGEDPYLSSDMVVPYVRGVQSNGVAACVKHFAVNNQESGRLRTNVNISDRALYEIYLPAFKAAVQEGHAWSIMGSYNQYKGYFNCHNPYLLNNILKKEWGFDGAVLSDWGGAHDTDQAIANGLDIEFGTWTNGLNTSASNAYDNYYMAKPYLDRINSGKVGTSELDDKAGRVLHLMMRTCMDRKRPLGKFTSPEHYAAARKIGDEAIVLLKNEGGLLPVKSSVKKILVVGENAFKKMTVGGGSSSLKVQHEISPLDGIKARFKAADVVYERGYLGDTASEYNGVKSGQNLNDSRSPQKLISDAVAAAENADYVIFIGGLNKSNHQDCEGADRLSMSLPYGQDAVIEALAAANKNLVVVNISGNAIAMPWIEKVPAVIQDWYLGSEAGNSLADVLSGDVNPSGKLPFTFPVALSDGPLKSREQYPGVAGTRTFGGNAIMEETYSEGIFVGYRWYEHAGIKPLFPFGYGLSYTTFEVGQAKISKKAMAGAGDISVSADPFAKVPGRETLRISVPVKNTGSVAGAEVVQLYISDPKASVVRPVKELKGFSKVFLNPGESKEVSFEITPSSLAYFDEARHVWVAEAGEFRALIGTSSSDIATSVSFMLK
ncbi:MAG: glycoside hydrolase family 3 C-terminal domain-containing protein [Bacteroidales bacterium]|jgi:beta-glucosidase|nr:glycoside hydrolase family 3 C-terminal domain-containing protein [Bacteroidales bacterium]MCI1785827.1 glycoside hydrolase family 3 C-terminal domain-containing protein [Bacteroidales bacterium]